MSPVHGPVMGGMQQSLAHEPPGGAPHPATWDSPIGGVEHPLSAYKHRNTQGAGCYTGPFESALGGCTRRWPNHTGTGEKCTPAPAAVTCTSPPLLPGLHVVVKWNI